MRIFLLASMSWLATDRSPSICISLTLIQSDRPLQHVFVIRSMVSSSNFSVLGIFYSFINWNSTTDVSGEIFLISQPKALFGKILVDIFSLSSQMETNALNRATKNGVVCLPYISRSGIDDAEKENAQKKSLKSSNRNNTFFLHIFRNGETIFEIARSYPSVLLLTCWKDNCENLTFVKRQKTGFTRIFYGWNINI